MSVEYLDMPIPKTATRDTAFADRFKNCPPGKSFVVGPEDGKTIAVIRSTCAYWSKKLGGKFGCQKLEDGRIQVWREIGGDNVVTEAAPPGPAIPDQGELYTDYERECAAAGREATFNGFIEWKIAKTAPAATMPGSWLKPEGVPCANPSCRRLPEDHPGWGCAEWVAS